MNVLEVDYIIMESIYMGKSYLEHNGIEYSIDKNEDTNEVLITISQFSDRSSGITTILFDKIDLNTLKLRECFITFNDMELIESNEYYKILSTLKFDYPVKCIAYLLLSNSGNKSACTQIINKMRNNKILYGEVKSLLELLFRSRIKLHEKL